MFNKYKNKNDFLKYINIFKQKKIYFYFYFPKNGKKQ